MKKYLNYAIIGASCLLIGRYILQPKAKVEVREVVKYVEKKEETTKKKKKTTVKETINTDGSSVTETVIVEDTVSDTKTEVIASKESSKKTSSGKGITLGVLAITDVAEFRRKPDVGVVVTVPLVGNLSVAALADSSRRVGVGLSLEF